MFNELSQRDIEKMQEEIDYRITVLRPKISKEIIEARAHGDLSENAEYHAARREKGKNEGRIDYLRAMIKTAKIVSTNPSADEVGLFDKIKVRFVEEGEVEDMIISTTMQNDASKNIVSRESPFGQAVLGHKKGEKITIKVSNDYSYHVIIEDIKKGSPNDIDLPLS